MNTRKGQIIVSHISVTLSIICNIPSCSKHQHYEETWQLHSEKWVKQWFCRAKMLMSKVQTCCCCRSLAWQSFAQRNCSIFRCSFVTVTCSDGVFVFPIIVSKCFDRAVCASLVFGKFVMDAFQEFLGKQRPMLRPLLECCLARKLKHGILWLDCKWLTIALRLWNCEFGAEACGAARLEMLLQRYRRLDRRCTIRTIWDSRRRVWHGTALLFQIVQGFCWPRRVSWASTSVCLSTIFLCRCLPWPCRNGS